MSDLRQKNRCPSDGCLTLLDDFADSIVFLRLTWLLKVCVHTPTLVTPMQISAGYYESQPTISRKQGLRYEDYKDRINLIIVWLMCFLSIQIYASSSAGSFELENNARHRAASVILSLALHIDHTQPTFSPSPSLLSCTSMSNSTITRVLMSEGHAETWLGAGILSVARSTAKDNGHQVLQ